jgi:hypothetical protein
MGIGMSKDCCTMKPDTAAPMSIPLVLVHDKERSLSETYRLSSIGRDVLEIDDPHSHDAEVLERGMPEMAREYCAMVERRVPSGGDIILGGREKLSLFSEIEACVDQVLCRKATGRPHCVRDVQVLG